MNNQILKDMLQNNIQQVKLPEQSSSGEEPIRVARPGAIYDFIEPLRHCPQQHVLAFHLNLMHEIIGISELDHPHLWGSLLCVSDVFRPAVLWNSAFLVFAHNHRCGIATPSNQDASGTRSLVEAGILLGIGVLDHIIADFQGFLSMRDEYPELWRPILCSVESESMSDGTSKMIEKKIPWNQKKEPTTLVHRFQNNEPMAVAFRQLGV